MKKNQTSSQPDLALIGAGYWGKNLARNFLELGVLHTLCDQSDSTLSSYREEYAQTRKTTSPQTVFDDPSITRVVIAAPASMHFELARAALLAGKDVMVEKPICLDADQGEELVELANRRGRILMVGHLLRYHPCVEKLQELLAQGGLGKLHYISSNRLNLGKIRSEENALWSFAPHDISVILSLVGDKMPLKLSCVGESYLNHGVADTTLTTFRFGGGIRAHIYVTWLNPFKEQKLTVVGSEAMAVFDDTLPWPEKLVLHRQYLTWANGQIPTPSRKKGEPVLVAECEPLRIECEHFLTCCRERRQPRTDGQEGLRVLRILQSAQRSLEQDGAMVSFGSDVPPLVFEDTPHRRAPVLNDSESDYFVHPTAVVDEGARIGKGTKVWHFSHVMPGAQIGERCIFGQNVNVDSGTRIGNNVKIQNNVSIYNGVEIEDDAFLGPSCVLTNVTNPRSQVNRHKLYEKTLIRRGATIGANATIVCGVTIGRYAFVGAGAVVTKDVPDYALVVGNPARQTGWMSRHGQLLKNPDNDGIMICPETGFRYQLEERAVGGDSADFEPRLRCLDLDEETSLPEQFTVGVKTYDNFKHNGARLVV